MVSITQNIYSKIPQVFAGKTSKKNENKHVVGIVDSFCKKDIDVDGDGIKDCSHGKFCNVIAKAANPDLKIINFKLRPLPKNPGLVNVDSIGKKFNEIANRIKNGEKFEAINLSNGANIYFDDLSEYIGTSITRDNVHEYKKEIRNWLSKLENPEMSKIVSKLDPENTGYKRIYKIISAIEEVTKLGIPVYIAAGNDGAKSFNLFNLAEGCIPVGAVNSDKEDARKTDFTADNSMVNRFGKGIFYTSSVFRKNGSLLGYSITDNNQVNFRKKEVSGKTPVGEFVNKPLKDKLATKEDYKNLQELTLLDENKLNKFIQDHSDELKKLSHVIFEIDKLAEIRGLNPEYITFLKRKGDYVDRNLENVFRVNKYGNIICDSEESGKTDKITKGTSFASPFVMAKDILKKYSQDKDAVVFKK